VNNLKIDQSVLTGDALPVTKNTYALSKEASIADQKCMAFAGSFVVSGSGWGVTVACGKNTAHSKLLSVKKQPKTLSISPVQRKLNRLGIVANNKRAAKLLAEIDTIFVDTLLPDKQVHEMIHKIQLGLGIPCVFCLPTTTAERLKAEIPGATIYKGSAVSEHVSRQIMSMMVDVQFIADASYGGLLKIISVMQQHGSKILWVSDGRNESQIIGAATASMIVGNISRDDNLFKADLIAPHSTPLIIQRILHNRK
jgi:hypothetical protein